MKWKTRMEKENDRYLVSPEYLKNKAMENMFRLMPEEGETFTFQGGLGNKVVLQTKTEDGKYYKRYSEDEEWQDDDPLIKMLELVKDIRKLVENRDVKKDDKFKIL